MGAVFPIIFQISSNIVALITAIHFIPGFEFTGNYMDLILAALFLALINTLIKPVLKLILTPLIIITLGLFVIVANALLLHLLDILSEPINIKGYLALFLGTIVIGVVNILINAGAKIRYRKTN